MLKIEQTNFREKFTELNIRQRLYQDKNYITLMLTTEFYPSLANNQLVSGVVEAKIDIQDISSLDDLVGKYYQGDIGSVTISVNNNGIWENIQKDNFEVTIKERKGRDLTFELKTDNCHLDTTGVMVSLYTTSSTASQLDKIFNLKDFYETPVTKTIGKNEVIKYFVKE